MQKLDLKSDISQTHIKISKMRNDRKVEIFVGDKLVVLNSQDVWKMKNWMESYLKTTVKGY